MVEPICLICRKRGCQEHKWLMNRLLKAVSPIEHVERDFFGSGVTPFVGSYNYPYVNLGILAPPKISPEAWKSDSPNYWFKEKYGLADILEKRTELVNSRIPINVKRPKGKFIEIAQEIALAKKTPDTEFFLKKRPNIALFFNNRSAPVTSPAPLEKAKITENVSVSSKIEKIVDDYDLKATEGVLDLYSKGIDINRIMRVFSVGLLGLKAQRKLVPTKFSITAIDDIIGKNLREKIKSYPELNEYLVFTATYLENHYEILFLPGTYEYELIESWLPKDFATNKKRIRVFSDYEPYWGRKTYADKTAGAFYAGRFSCLTYLDKIKRQGSIIIFREVLPSYFFSLGIWQMRETCLGALKTKAEKFDTLNDALNKINSRMHVSLNYWTKKSKLLKNRKTQTRLNSFFNSQKNIL